MSGIFVKGVPNNKLIVGYYETIDISSSTTGTISFPTGATLETKILGELGNCTLGTIDGNGHLIEELPTDTSGSVIESTLDTNGNWSTTGNSTDNTVLLFYLEISLGKYDNLAESKIIEVSPVNERLEALTDDPTWTSATWGNSLSITVGRLYNFYITIPSGTSDGPQVIDASSFSSWDNGKPILLKYINNDSSDQSVDWAAGVKGVDSLSDPSGITANTEVSFTLVKDENGTLTVLSKQVYQTF